MKYFAILLLAIPVLLTSHVCADDLPDGVSNTQNPDDISLTPAESLAKITAPDGFSVTLFAGEPDVRRPIAFDFDDRGRLWVVENYSHPNWSKDTRKDRIVIFEDADHDGTFDKRTVFWDKGRYVTAIAVGHGGVWIGNTPDLAFLPDRDHNDVPDSEPIVMLDGFTISKNNVLNNFHWGHDGWLYGAIGLTEVSMIGKPGAAKEERSPISRGLWRFHPQRHVFEKIAEGMVNPWGADFNEYGDLITSNTVLAHLWHIVPGMYCERRFGERDNPFAYGRIQTIANHLHWGGGNWTASRSPANQRKPKRKPNEAKKKTHDHDDHDAHWDQHSVAGGGHAHCGGMVYLGDNWPDTYRGTYFTNNLHGSRVNNDQLVPTKSTYVGVHNDDLLHANDPWFRGMSIKYGPDGGVYITDWHDTGECHDGDGSHYTSGRIYKALYKGEGKAADSPPNTLDSFDLQKSSSDELVALHLHENEWFSRHARRILQERAAAKIDLSSAVSSLRQMLANGKEDPLRLRAMWSLYVVGALDPSQLIDLTRDVSPHIRRWAIRFLMDHQSCDMSPLIENDESPVQPISPSTTERMLEMAQSDPSPKVRLELACALQRLPHTSRIPLATALANHAEDATDPYLPLMTWYGVEPAVTENANAALQLAHESKIDLIRKHVARRLVDVSDPPVEQVTAAVLTEESPAHRLDLLQGMLEGLGDRGSVVAPASWAKLYDEVCVGTDPALQSVAVRLAMIFGDRRAIEGLRETAVDTAAKVEDRQQALRSLLRLDDGASLELLHRLAKEESPLRRDAISALAVKNEPATSDLLIQRYKQLDEASRQAAIGVLATRESFAEKLLQSIADGAIDRKDVSAYALQQLRLFKKPELQEQVRTLWANDANRLEKSDEIARYKSKMTPDYLSHGSAADGRAVFDQTCAKCHTLFGEGGTIAPDLTGSGRANSDYVLQNLIDPSAEIDAAYRLTTLITNDGRLLNGFIVQQDDRGIIFRTQDARFRIEMKDVDELNTNDVSMMPEGMLRTFTDEQVRDLLLYLASPHQVTPE